MLDKPDEKTLRVLYRLNNDSDGKVFLLWIHESLQSLLRTASFEKDGAVLRQKQGAAQLLFDMEAQFKNAKETLERVVDQEDDNFSEMY